MVPSNVCFQKRRLLGACLVSLVAAGVTTGCDSMCNGLSRYPVTVEVRDPEGEPAASGARVIVTTEGVIDTAWVWLGAPPPILSIQAGDAGTDSHWAKVRVEKPWYEVVELLVGVNQDGCDAPHPSQVQVDLTLLPNAPPVRSVFVGGEDLTYSAGDTLQLYAAVDAAAGISDSVVWWSSETTLAVVDETGFLLTKCRDVSGQAYVGATSAADSTVSGSVRVWVYTPIGGCS